MRAVFFSHRGNKRRKNEDALLVSGCVVSEALMESPAVVFSDRRNALLVVADGMGGYEGGALAARMLVLSLLERFGGEESVDETELRNVLCEVAGRMKATAALDGSLGGMGTTFAGLAAREEGVCVFNCGDCRVYRFHGGYLDKLSRDHSVVQELVDSGTITEEEMRTHPRKNMVTSAVQVNADMSMAPLFFKNIPAAGGEKFFICSDGVWEALPLTELEECLGAEDMLKGCDELGRKLLETDCEDNVAFVFAEI